MFIEEYVYELTLKIAIDEIETVNFDDFIYFLKSRTGKTTIECKVDEIVIHHLTSRVSSPKLTDNLYNLYESLLQPTDISNFFKVYGIEFKKSDDSLLCFYKGELINWDDFESSGTVAMVKRRLNNKDHCINGYLLPGEIFKYSNVNSLKYYPEILDNIMSVLNINIHDWLSKRKIYIITFKAKFRDIIIDGKDNLNVKQKLKYIFECAILYLSNKLINRELSEWENPVIRLKDELSVSSENILIVQEIEC